MSNSSATQLCFTPVFFGALILAATGRTVAAEGQFPREDGVYRRTIENSVSAFKKDYNYLVFRKDKLVRASGRYVAPSSYRLVEPEADGSYGGVYDRSYFAEECPLAEQPRLLLSWIDGIYSDAYESHDIPRVGGVLGRTTVIDKPATSTDEAFRETTAYAIHPSRNGLVEELTVSRSDSEGAYSNTWEYEFIPAAVGERPNDEVPASESEDIHAIVRALFDKLKQSSEFEPYLQRIAILETRMNGTGLLPHMANDRLYDYGSSTGLRGLDRQLAASRAAVSQALLAEEAESYYRQMSLARRNYELALNAQVWERLNDEQREQAVSAQIITRPTSFTEGQFSKNKNGQGVFTVGQFGFYFEFPAEPRRRYHEYDDALRIYVAEYKGMFFRVRWGTMTQLCKELFDRFPGSYGERNEQLLSRHIVRLYNLDSDRDINIEEHNSLTGNHSFEVHRGASEIRAKLQMVTSREVENRFAIWSVMNIPENDPEAGRIATAFLNSRTIRLPEKSS